MRYAKTLEVRHKLKRLPEPEVLIELDSVSTVWNLQSCFA